MSDASAFSPDYTAARARFRSSAMALGCEVESYPIEATGPQGEELTIDFAGFGDRSAKRVIVISSGLHGVEGYLGSAVQASVLEDKLGGFVPPTGTALLLIHALNPYGFAWSRRVNEDNADLNRNFLLAGQEYVGSPPKYASLDSLLNPPSPPRFLDPFLLKAAVKIAKHGLPALKETVAGGQYEFPRGLFFGGSAPSATLRILDQVLPSYVGAAERVLHLDFHTGLGKSGEYKLLVDRAAGSAEASWLGEKFGSSFIQPWSSDGVSYAIRGGMGVWLQQRFPRASYDVLTAEFGTFHVIRIISALRSENQAHQWGQPDQSSTIRAKEELREAFSPKSQDWRKKTVSAGLKLVDQALEAGMFTG